MSIGGRSSVAVVAVAVGVPSKEAASRLDQNKQEPFEFESVKEREDARV